MEAARSEVFSAINAATALRHSLEHGATTRDRVAETLSKLHVEADDARIETDRVAADSASCARRAQARAGDHRGDARSRARRANRSWRARESSTSGARDRCAPASTSWPGSTPG